VFSHNSNHPLQCSHQYACPHVGGASLGLVVADANDFEEQANTYRRENERLRQEIARRDRELERLREDLDDLRRELKAVHRRAFQKHRRSDAADNEAAGSASLESLPKALADEANQPKKKRGAPIGHVGWYRSIPTEFDRVEEVVPARCSYCDGDVIPDSAGVWHNHVQEDWVEGRIEVVCFRHPAARCSSCGRDVEVAGPGELLGCPIGPNLKARANYLHFEVGLTCRKVQAVCQELLGFKFAPASVLGFDQQLNRRAQPLAADIAHKLEFSMVVYADETYWTIDGRTAYVWFHGNEDLAYFQIDTSRSGEVSRKILGEKFDGILSTDCYSGYEKHSGKAKQKCLAHLRRTAKDWLELVPPPSQAATFFNDIVSWVQRACALHRACPPSGIWTDEQRLEIDWLRKEFGRLKTMNLDHQRAKRLQKRLQKHDEQWLTFLTFPEVSPTNNLAERALRPLVIQRKITYGNRSAAGAARLGVIHSVLETAKRQGHRPLSFLTDLWLQPKDKMLTALYRPPKTE
jgi:transposase